MNTYWSLSQMERAKLTQEQINAILDVELMSKGVLKPVAPKTREVPGMPVKPSRTYYGLTTTDCTGGQDRLNIIFESKEAVQKFIDLKPMIKDYNYQVGTDYYYAAKITGFSMQIEELYTPEEISAYQQQLKQRKAIQDEDKKAQEVYQSAIKKVEEVTGAVWSDYYECQSIQYEMSAICETFRHYKELTKGDERLALTFLLKAYHTNKVDAAREWFPEVIPPVTPPPTAQLLEKETELFSSDGASFAHGLSARDASGNGWTTKCGTHIDHPPLPAPSDKPRCNECDLVP